MNADLIYSLMLLKSDEQVQNVLPELVSKFDEIKYRAICDMIERLPKVPLCVLREYKDEICQILGERTGDSNSSDINKIACYLKDSVYFDVTSESKAMTLVEEIPERGIDLISSFLERKNDSK